MSSYLCLAAKFFICEGEIKAVYKLEGGGGVVTTDYVPILSDVFVATLLLGRAIIGSPGFHLIDEVLLYSTARLAECPVNI